MKGKTKKTKEIKYEYDINKLIEEIGNLNSKLSTSERKNIEIEKKLYDQEIENRVLKNKIIELMLKT